MNIKPRSAWGAKPPTRPGQPWADHGPIDLVVHWVGGSGSLFLSDPARVPQAIRAIQASEMAGGVYSDIAYNLVLDPWGQLWEGRTLAVRGAANGPETNGTKPSVCLLLNQNDLMTQPMKETVKAMRVSLTPGQLYGHREVNATSCPGNDVMSWISDQRQPRPPTPPLPVMELDPMYLMRGDKTPHVWIVSGGTKRHLDAAAYPSWLVWSLVHIPSACDPATHKEWVVPQVMVDALKPLL